MSLAIVENTDHIRTKRLKVQDCDAKNREKVSKVLEKKKKVVIQIIFDVRCTLGKLGNA